MSKERALRDLVLQKGLDQQLDDVVQRAEETILLLEGGSGMKTSQLQNAINVTNETPSVPVVVNFIRYQLGRAPQGKPWQYNGFGLQVVSDIDGDLREAAGAAVDEAFRQAADIGLTLTDSDRAGLEKRALRRLVPLYLGYLNRAFAFVDKTGNWDHLRQAVSGEGGG